MANGAGIAIGVALGVAIGLAMDNIIAGIGIGIALGIALNLAMRQQQDELGALTCRSNFTRTAGSNGSPAISGPYTRLS